MDNNVIDLINDTKLYEYAKIGMEQTLTELCKDLGMYQYLSKNDYLKQEYSLTTPFNDYDNLGVFLEVLDDIKENVRENFDEGAKTTQFINHRVDDLINVCEKMRDYLALREQKLNDNKFEIEFEPDF